jgi:hypothetical protein
MKRARKKPTFHKPIISPVLAWLERYLRKSKKKMPALTMPLRIRSWKHTTRKEQRVWGTCDQETRTITLATHKIIYVRGKKRMRRKAVALSRKDILQTFAHELAHLRYDDHTYEQGCYGRTIFDTFGTKDKCPTCNGKGKVPAVYKNE